MLHQYLLPDPGEGLQEAEIVAWRVAAGDVIKVNDVLLEIETAKSIVELPSPFAGTVTRLIVAEGSTVEVGTPIVEIDDGLDDEPVETIVGEVADEAPATLVGYGEREQRGSRRRRGRAARGSDRSNADMMNEAYSQHEPGRRPDEMQPASPVHAQPVGDPLPTPGKAPTESALVLAHDADDARAKPPVRKYARDLGVDLAGVVGTGPDGTITRRDVEAAAAFMRMDAEPKQGRIINDAASFQQHHEAPPTYSPSGGFGTAAPGGGFGGGGFSGGGGFGGGTPGGSAFAGGFGAGFGGGVPGGMPGGFDPFQGKSERRVPIKGVRKVTAENMVRSRDNHVHVTEWTTVDVTGTMEFVETLKERREFAGLRISPLLVYAKAVCLALGRNPELNTSWDDETQEIVYHADVNLGIAAATPRGLMVPNIKGAQRLSLIQLAQALNQLVQVARDGKLQPGDYSGGTFTITNVGVFGIDSGTPIINGNESAIFCMGSIDRRPWVVGQGLQERIEPRWVTTLSVAFDHRIVDGEQGSRFLHDIAEILAEPALALLF
ncbi:dihydrolipoamide acetyltransferase family protein [Tessaracoccus caeni]|uniref:dihydrolipoamide acetyltransferase family protein n=1 Tax=Tessaracoccus caeni TaxID=3031239 RepID=UPI0023DB1F2C|nr:dihydrolipoamide acetyltransferase family protein [Tessaracoccus caeni]MDF1489010.1 dihydrolipoamide acetyltransferase family protein [Tessaracoccus caeni]